MRKFIEALPKAELHVHIEGTYEPDLMFAIAQRNGISIKYQSVEELRAAYAFNNLQEFLDIYYEGACSLIHEEDFYDLTMAYLRKARSQNVLHADIMFDPQTHTDRGIAFDTVIQGIRRAQVDAEKELGISSELIMSFLRHLDADSAMKTLEEGLKYKDWIKAVGLDSSEKGNPPSKFIEVYDRARAEGFLACAHAGEEGPAAYIWEALQLLEVVRIDHGNRCLEDDILVQELVRRQIPLTVCPLSNLKLCVVNDLKEHPLKRMMELGLYVTINSDDPPYFGGYINENYLAMHEHLALDRKHLYQLARNSFEASFASDVAKNQMIAVLDAYMLQA